MEKVDSILLVDYYEKFSSIAQEFLSDEKNLRKMEECVRLLGATRDTENTIFLIGNGGSASVAEHIAIDLTKNAGLKAMAISGSPMLTTFANDYGYENVFSKALERFAKKGDILIAISSSGSSKNILNACDVAKEKEMFVITLSGFDRRNPLNSKGDINLWVDTKAFGFLEIFHGFLLHYINDSIIGTEVYMIR